MDEPGAPVLPPRCQRSSRYTTGLLILAACGLALHPLLTVLATNVGVVPVGGPTIVRAALAALVLAVALVCVLRLTLRQWMTATVGLGALVLSLELYGWVTEHLVGLHGSGREDWRLAVVHGFASVLGATAVVHVWRTRSIEPSVFTVTAGLLLTLSVLDVVREARTHADRWRSAAAAFQDLNGTVRHTHAAPRRDIYYIVLDGLGRPDVLRDAYGLDLEPLVATLRGHGFYMADRARSNYGQTFLSLASTLNMAELDTLATALGSDSRDRRPLHQVIRTNALMELAHEAGYRVVTIGSDYAATMQFDVADRCDCRQYGLSELEQAALALTPFAALPLDRWTHDAHRRKVLDSLAALEEPPPGDRPTLVFAHIVAPHPPFVFDADGRPRDPVETLLGFRDGDHFPGSAREYVDGYRDQARYVTRRVLRIVEGLLQRPGRKPAIVIHGDHGPGSMLHWERPQDTNMDERMGIFAAYYLPDDGPALYPDISPLNGARALATRYFGVDLPFVPERSRFSTWSRPYDFHLVASHSAASHFSGDGRWSAR